MELFVLFFFSSRRRHTRSYGDWSSDVCSSDLWADELARDFVPWGWLVLFVGPPLLVWLGRRRGAAAHVGGTAPAAAPAPLSRLGRLEREFQTLLASHVPDASARDGDGLARALRATGVDSAVADHVKRLRDRLRASRYGPRGLGDAV